MSISKATLVVLALIVCATWALPYSLCAQVLDDPIPEGSDGIQRADGTASGDEQADEIQRVGWFNIPMPKITMPKITMPKMPTLWPSNSQDQSAALLAPVASGFNKISSGTKKAWEGTKEVFSAGSTKSAQPAQARPSLWQRLVGRPTKPEGPQTVGEFMSQPRLDP